MKHLTSPEMAELITAYDKVVVEDGDGDWVGMLIGKREYQRLQAALAWLSNPDERAETERRNLLFQRGEDTEKTVALNDLFPSRRSARE